jgi:hypothetical protein
MTSSIVSPSILDLEADLEMCSSAVDKIAAAEEAGKLQRYSSKRSASWTKSVEVDAKAQEQERTLIGRTVRNSMPREMALETGLA